MRQPDSEFFVFNKQISDHMRCKRRRAKTVPQVYLLSLLVREDVLQPESVEFVCCKLERDAIVTAL